MATRALAAGPRKVGEIMKTSVVSVSPEQSIRELVQVLAREGISGAPVIDAVGRVVGVVSATDVLRFAAQEGEVSSGQVAWSPRVLPEEVEGDDGLATYFLESEPPAGFTFPADGELAETGLDELTVRDIMTPVAFSVRPGDFVSELVLLLLRGRIHRALVVEDGKLLGIVTPFDVLAADYADAN